MSWIDEHLASDHNVLVHCVGGLGRAGTVAGCWLRTKGVDGENAIQIVRDFRSPRAIETAHQEQTVISYLPKHES